MTINRRVFLRRAATSSAGLAVARGTYAQERIASTADHFAHDRELPWRTVSEVAPLPHSGTITSVELTEFMLQRIEQLDPTYHSYLTVMKAEALRDARLADREMRAKRYRGPLHGVPVAVKDLCYTKGTKTTAGRCFSPTRVDGFSN